MADVQEILKSAIANGVIIPSRMSFLLCQASTEIDRLRAENERLTARLAEAERDLAAAVEANAAWVTHYQNLGRDMADWRAYAEYQYAKTKEHGYPVQGALDAHFAKWRMARHDAARAEGEGKT